MTDAVRDAAGERPCRRTPRGNVDLILIRSGSRCRVLSKGVAHSGSCGFTLVATLGTCRGGPERKGSGLPEATPREMGLALCPCYLV